jgi:hypothetical protein
VSEDVSEEGDRAREQVEEKERALGPEGKGRQVGRVVEKRYFDNMALPTLFWKTKARPGNPCLELQDTLQQLPPEIHHKMLPSSRTIDLRRTSKAMRAAVEKEDAVVWCGAEIGSQAGKGRWTI